ncbi:calmodulin-A-like [Daphnia pulex]|uniref:calmodulin-A-like n=1 Tax=Daphnia pulex TaxID=6669 RepID=UPI001EDCB041|nr:calmodulin-A-like [Daphnia pulex]
MAFAAARMILKDKRRKPSREEYSPRNRSKARGKQSEGSIHLSTINQPVGSPKPPLTKSNDPGAKSNCQQSAKSSGKNSGNNRNNQKASSKKPCNSNNQHDLTVTIDLSEHGLTEDQVADFKEAFIAIDKDEDGLITVTELGKVMKSLGQRSTDKELKTLVREVSNSNLRNTVEFNEFLQLMSKKLKNDGCEEELLEAFRVFDKLGEGWIMSADLRDVMQHLGERLSDIEVDDMLKEADRDNNGRVFYQEFVELLTK